MTWYDVLKSVRKISKAGDEITSGALSRETGLSIAIASAWLSNFYHWGYVVPIGKKNGRGRPSNLYRITSWGERFRPAAQQVREGPAPLRKAANPKKEEP